MKPARYRWIRRIESNGGRPFVAYRRHDGAFDIRGEAVRPGDAPIFYPRNNAPWTAYVKTESGDWFSLGRFRTLRLAKKRCASA